jgi:hypothetical protein
MRQFQHCLQMGRRRGGRHSNPKAAYMPKWAQRERSQEIMWESGGKVGDEAGKRVMKCEMCTENDKEGSGWERQSQLRLQRCRTWPGMY